MRSRSSRLGFTLTELLVVIAIIGILASIAVPAVMVAYGTAEKTACLNNLRQLGTAVENYHTDKGNFPASFYDRTSTDALATSYTHNWFIALLPYLDQQKMSDDLKGDPSLIAVANVTEEALALKSAQIPQALCPSDQYDDFGGALSYAANCGRIDPREAGTYFVHTAPLLTSSFRDPDGKGSGIFYDRSTATSRGTPIPSVGVTNARSIKMDKSDVYDGLGQTILIAERSNPRFAVESGLTAPRWYHSYEQAVGVVWRDYSFLPDGSVAATNVDLSQTDFNNGTYIGFGQFTNFTRTGTPPVAAQIHFARPASLHAGGTNIVFCDGSTKTISSDIGYDIYCRMMTSDSREIEDPSAPVGLESRGLGVVTDDLFE